MTVGNGLPLALLLVYGAAFASWGLGLSLIGFDDHPGQLYRAWHVVTRGAAPWAWNWGWWAGYPELQFYPPAFPYAVALLHAVTRGALSVAASYQAFVWLACVLPGVTGWLWLRRALGDGWLALPGAFIAMTLSAGLASGVEGGVHTGMVPARLAWALLPLIALSLLEWVGGRRPFPWLIAPLVALVALTHPAHLPAAVVIVLVAAGWAPFARRAALGPAVAALALAAGLTAFWSVPLVAHLEHARPLAWGSLSTVAVGHPLAVLLVLLAGLDVLTRIRSRRDGPDASAVVTAFAWAMVVIVLAVGFVLEPAGIRWLPADRLADSAALGLVLSAGMATGRLLGAVAGDRAGARAGWALAAVALAAAIALPSRTLTLWPPAAGWERYATIERGLRLPALWSTLRAAPPGRVLFVRSGVPLVFGPDWWRPHSHVTALTPLAAGRDIVNGTFTHPSPVAAFVYRGDAGPGPIRELVERLDGRRLFGRDLDRLDSETFNTCADRLAVGTVVALEEDLPALHALRDNAQFARAASSPPFVIYTRRTTPALPRAITPDGLRLQIDSAGASWLSTPIAYYPLWRASSEGRPVETRRGEVGDLEVRSPRPGARIDLVYLRGGAETVGLTITALSLGALALVARSERRGRAS